jgi:hypothetical protein
VKGQALKARSVNAYAYAFNNPLRFVDPTGRDVPEDQDKLTSWADDLCRQCLQITFRVNKNGPSRGPVGEGGSISGTVTSWECKPAGCDSSKTNTSAGSIGVAFGAWENAVKAAPTCASGLTPIWVFDPADESPLPRRK